MAHTHQQSASAAKQLDDLSECPICTEVYTDPRVLPCVHTFCLKCIDKWGKDKAVDGKLACPMCRKEIMIPEGGFADLPKNFFVEKLMDVRKLAGAFTPNETLCDVYKEDQPEGVQSTATVYCVDCRHHMCKQCHRYHQKFKSNSQHRVVELSSNERVDELLLKFPESACDKHPDKNREIYCLECKFATCMMCYITSHNSHKCSDVKVVACETTNGMKADVDGVQRKVVEVDGEIQQLRKELESFVVQAGKVKMEVSRRAEEMKKWIDDYKMSLLDELKGARNKKKKQLENLCHELEGKLTMMESFLMYSEELLSNGTACDVVTAAESLHERAKELIEFNSCDELRVERLPVDVKLSPGLKKGELEYIFGQLSVDSSEDGDEGLCDRCIQYRNIRLILQQITIAF